MRKRTLLHWTLGGLVALGAVATLGAGSARADLRTTYGTGPVVWPGASVPSVRAIAVDNNPGSAWYGCVFVADAGGTTAAPQRRVMILRPDPANNGTSANAYVDTGATIAVPDQPGGNGSAFAPFGVCVGEDDTVWVTNYDDRTVETFALPAAIPMTAGSMGSTTIQIRMANFDEEAKASSGGTAAQAGGSPRAIFVNGPITAANVFLGNYDGTTKAAQRYAVASTSASTPGTVNHLYTTLLTTSIGPYGIAADADNNAYAPVRAATGGTAVVKLSPTGAPDTTFGGKLPAGYTDSAYASIWLTKESSGLEYLYYSFRNGTAGNTVVIRYDKTGNYLDGFGAAGTTALPNFTPLSITGSTTQYVASDDKGNVYQRYVNGSNSAVMKVFKRVPIVVASANANSAGGAVKSSPTAVDGVVYFGSDDGKLYAYDTGTGNPIANFPVDVSTKTVAGVKVQSRAAVYITSAGKGIYFTTDRGDVCRVSADGLDFTAFTGLAGASSVATVSTPAVMPDGTVYAGVSNPGGSGIVKLSPDLSTSLGTVLLGDPGSTISSVAVYGNSVYVGLTGGTSGDIVVLNAMDLTPRAAGVANGEGVTAPPFVSGGSAYVGTMAGNFYKVNSITFAPDTSFGAGGTGKAAIGEALPGGAFNDGNDFYVGSAKGKVWKVDGTTGAFSTLYDTGDAASIPGVVVNRASNTLAFGTSAGIFYQVPTDVTSGPVNAQVFRGYGAFNTTPTVSKATDNSGETPVTSYRFLIGSADGNVYAFSNR